MLIQINSLIFHKHFISLHFKIVNFWSIGGQQMQIFIFVPSSITIDQYFDYCLLFKPSLLCDCLKDLCAEDDSKVS